MIRLGVAVLALVLASTASAHRVVVMVGDSTTQGVIPSVIVPTSPPSALGKLLELQPRENPWRRAKVLNYGIFGTTTDDWLRPIAASQCAELPRHFHPLLTAACKHDLRLVDAVLASLPHVPDAVLIVLGVNDALTTNDATHTVDNLVRIAAALAPAPTFIAPPFRTTVPAQQQFVAAVRQTLLDRNLLTGPDWPPLPTADGLHLTEGGYAAAGGLWLDILLPLRDSDPRLRLGSEND